MTLIFARNNSLEALREALEARRTLAYSFGTIAGDEQLLKDLFTASVQTKVLHTDPSNGRRTVSLTNGSRWSTSSASRGRIPSCSSRFRR